MVMVIANTMLNLVTINFTEEQEETKYLDTLETILSMEEMIMT